MQAKPVSRHLQAAQQSAGGLGAAIAPAQRMVSDVLLGSAGSWSSGLAVQLLGAAVGYITAIYQAAAGRAANSAALEALHLPGATAPLSRLLVMVVAASARAPELQQPAAAAAELLELITGHGDRAAQQACGSDADQGGWPARAAADPGLLLSDLAQLVMSPVPVAMRAGARALGCLLAWCSGPQVAQAARSLLPDQQPGLLPRLVALVEDSAAGGAVLRLLLQLAECSREAAGALAECDNLQVLLQCCCYGGGGQQEQRLASAQQLLRLLYCLQRASDGSSFSLAQLVCSAEFADLVALLLAADKVAAGSAGGSAVQAVANAASAVWGASSDDDAQAMADRLGTTQLGRSIFCCSTDGLQLLVAGLAQHRSNYLVRPVLRCLRYLASAAVLPLGPSSAKAWAEAVAEMAALRVWMPPELRAQALEVCASLVTASVQASDCHLLCRRALTPYVGRLLKSM